MTQLTIVRCSVNKVSMDNFICRTPFTHLNVNSPQKSNFPRNTKILAAAKLMHCWKDVLRHFGKMRLCDVVVTSALLYHNVATTSLLNVATALSTDIGKMFISSELTTPRQWIVSSDFVTKWWKRLCVCWVLHYRTHPWNATFHKFLITRNRKISFLL